MLPTKPSLEKVCKVNIKQTCNSKVNANVKLFDVIKLTVFS